MGLFFQSTIYQGVLRLEIEDLFLFVSKEVLARECYQYLYRLLKDKLSLTSSLEDILFIYQTSLCYQQDSIFNRYSINETIKRQAKELLSLIDDECYSLPQSDKKSIHRSVFYWRIL